MCRFYTVELASYGSGRDWPPVTCTFYFFLPSSELLPPKRVTFDGKWWTKSVIILQCTDLFFFWSNTYMITNAPQLKIIIYLCLSLLNHQDAFSLRAQQPWSDLFWGVLLAFGLLSPQFPLLKNNLLPLQLYFNIPFLAIAPFPFFSGFGVSSSSFFWSIFIHGWN